MSKNTKLILVLVLASVIFSVLGIIIDPDIKSAILFFLLYGILITTIEHIAGTFLIGNNRNKLLYLTPVVINIVLITCLIYSFYNPSGILGGLAEYVLIYSFVSATMYNFVLFFFSVKE